MTRPSAGTPPRRLVTLLGLLLVLGLGRAAAAGRSHYAWLYGTEINPERGVELETWIQEENGKGGDQDETLIWWAPVASLTEHLELAVPIELAYAAAPGTGGATGLERWGGELRYRVDSPDPIAAGDFTLLFRGGLKRLVAERDGIRAEADVVAAYEHGRLHAEVDVGGVWWRTGGASFAEFRPGGGASLEVANGLRFGLEGYSELRVQGDSISWFALGPDVSLTSGRFWLTAGVPIGVVGIHAAPRINFAIAF